MSATATDPNLKHLTKAREQIAKGDLKNAALTLNKANALWPQDPASSCWAACWPKSRAV